jgi:hypothetical protein
LEAQIEEFINLKLNMADIKISPGKIVFVIYVILAMLKMNFTSRFAARNMMTFERTPMSILKSLFDLGSTTQS